MQLLLIKGSDTFFELREKKHTKEKKCVKFHNAFTNNLIQCGISLCLHLTARRLWLISAASMRLCLSGSLVSDALSLPARSTNHILWGHTQTSIFLGSVILHQQLKPSFDLLHNDCCKKDNTRPSVYHCMALLTCQLSAGLDI